jgi:monofunctional biosynthetic peptidoglycan transglycosylase
MLSFLWRWTWRLVAVALVAVLLVQCWFLGHIWWWKDHPPSATAFMRDRLAGLQVKDPKAKLRQRWVPYERISPNLKRAVIAAEDGKFLDHDGFDWEAIEKAHEKNRKQGKIVAGASTISQQLAKNLFLSGSRTWWRKGQEAVITLMLEQVLDKRRILEIYLNVIEWGEGVFGAEAAAQHYFGRPASQLTREQAARLAAMIPRPRFFDRNRASPWLERHTGVILGRMNASQVP